MDDDPEETYFDHEEVLSVGTSVQADAYIRRVFKAAGIPARDALFERFAARARDIVAAGVPVAPHADGVYVGGAELPTKAQSDKFYDFFQYVDSLHDFGEHIDPVDIAKSLGAELPEILKDGAWHQMVPLDIYGPDSTFVRDITAATKVRFAGVSSFDNPLHGRYFEQGMFRYDGRPEVQTAIIETSPPAAGCSHSEIWSFVDASQKILKLEQIVNAVIDISVRYGKDATFVVDESTPLTRLLLAMDLIYRSFLASFRIEATDAKDTYEIATWWKVWMEISTTWRAVTCDSGLMDAEAHDFELHDAPTGRVFRDGSLVQIEMLSSSVVKTGKRVEKKYAYRLSSDTIPVFRDGNERVVEVTNDKVGSVREYYSKNQMIGVMNNQLMQDDRNIAVPLAQKRAGDWGQVEHCRKYGTVFVTADKITALYAIYRGVRVMFVKTWRPADDMRWDFGSLEDIYRWSFVMYFADGG